MKKVLLIILTVILLGSSCQSVLFSERTEFDGYFDALRRFDFESAYKYFYTQTGNVSQEIYLNNWDKTVSSLRISKIDFSDIEVAGERLSYTLKYATDMLGDFTAAVATRVVDGKLYFSYDLIFPGMSNKDYVRRRTLVGARGEIFGAGGQLLAKADFSDTVYIKVSAQLDIKETIMELGEVIEIDEIKLFSAYQNALSSDYAEIVVASFNRGTLPQELRESLSEIPGIGVDNSRLTPQRYYPYNSSMAHIIGYLGFPTEKQLENDKNLSRDVRIGQTGLEASMDSYLRGMDGYAIELVDEYGRIKSTLKSEPAINGFDVATSLDPTLQQIAYFSLLSRLDEYQSGAVVVLDGLSGFTDAAVSYPSFDPNIFAYPIADDVYKSLTNTEANTPLFSRITQGAYPPGSAFKPFAITPSLEKGVITTSSVFTGKIQNNRWTPEVDGWNYPAITRNSPTRGEMNLHNTMRSSDNIFFAWASLQLGEKDFMSYLERVGFSKAASYDVPLKTPNILNKGSEMNLKLLADMGFGMGELLITPVQLAAMYTAFLNGGDILNPALVTSVYGTQGGAYQLVQSKATSVFRKNAINTSTVQALTPILEDVVKSGTANAVKTLGYKMAGKTGTAVVGAQGVIGRREISWLVLFMEEAPNKIILVMIDGPDTNAAVKFDVGNDIIKAIKNLE